MLPYLTPDGFRAMDLGTQDPGDAALRSHILRASAAVDRYCAAPIVPDRFSFRGGSVTDEEHAFDLGDGVTRGPQSIVWPNQTPLISVSRLRVYVTNTQYIEFDPAELVVTKDNVRIASLATTTVGLFGNYAIPIIGVDPPIVRISYAYGHSFTASDEILSTEDFLVYRGAAQFWTNADVIVKVNGDVVDSGFTVDRTEGTVTFDSAKEEDDVVTATYVYTLLPEVAQATGYTVAKYLADKRTQERGMAGLNSLTVGEIRMERANTRTASIAQSKVDLPPEAEQLLDGLNFISIR